MSNKPVTASIGDKKLEIPGDQPASAKAAAPLAALSSQIDPWPHYSMSAACAGGAGWAYSRMNNPRAAAIAGGFSVLYLFAGRLLVQGNDRLGYDLGTVTSLALLASAGPAAWTTGEAYVTTMATMGGVSSIANFVKSYQQRTGKPVESEVKNRH
ncbi:hypothetical protein QJQ45_026206 [Haematococcus lacustris]|nr:hypothetical protein QJQ45_026206 [Haematococcus lacustris]